jgi:hypothetical protein
LGDLGENAGKRLDVGKMLSSQRFELVVSMAGELEVDQAVVNWVAIALEQATGLGSLAEFDRAVVAHVQLLGDVCDARWTFDGVAANR